MSEHTATPWHFKQALAEFAGPDEERDFAIYADDAIIAEAFHKVGHNTYAPSEANAEYIVRCVNSHADLLAALGVCRAWLETTAFPSDNQELRDSAASLLVVTVEPAIEKHKP